MGCLGKGLGILSPTKARYSGNGFQTFSSLFHNPFPSVLPAAVQMPLVKKAGKYLDCNSMESAGVERMVRPYSTNMEKPSHQSVSKSWLIQSHLVISIKKWNVLELKRLTISTDWRTVSEFNNLVVSYSDLCEISQDLRWLLLQFWWIATAQLQTLLINVLSVFPFSIYCLL